MRILILTSFVLAGIMTFAGENDSISKVPNDQMPLFSCNAKLTNFLEGNKYVESKVSRNEGFSGTVLVNLKVSGEEISYLEVLTGQREKSTSQKLLNNLLRIFGPSQLTNMTGLIPFQITTIYNTLIYQFGKSESEKWGYFEVFVNEQGSPLGASLTLHEGQVVRTGACVPVNGFYYEKPVGF